MEKCFSLLHFGCSIAGWMAGLCRMAQMWQCQIFPTGAGKKYREKLKAMAYVFARFHVRQVNEKVKNHVR
jgi:hypothetical protein